MRKIFLWVCVLFLAGFSGAQVIDSEKGLATIRVAGSEEEAGYVRMFFLGRNGLMGRSMYLYSDRHDKAIEETLPPILHECLYYEVSSGAAHAYECLNGGKVMALAPVNATVDRTADLETIGFERLAGTEPFQLFGENPANTVGLFTRQVLSGEVIRLPAGIILAGFSPVRSPRYGEVLYNGIRLPREWPPRYDKEFWSSANPLPVPYLDNPPKLIPIDVGRQLFVDDFLVEETDLVREYHYPQKYENNPVLKPETDIERKGLNNLAVAGPKSGGLWWNPDKQIFEFWYEAGWVSTVAYATSRDGLVWERPELPLKPGSNQVLPNEIKPDSWTVVRDYRATDPKQNFKIFLRGGGARERARAFLSEDGIDWGKHTDCGTCGDRSTMFYNPFRKVWVCSLRSQTTGFGGRSRDYWEGDDFLEGMNWLPDEPVRWARTDKLDPPDPRIGDTPQLYNLDAVAYESILLGFFEVLHGPNNEIVGAQGFPKNTGLNFAYSRDGFHWHRPDRTIAINSEQRAVWDRGYVQPLGNICTVRGDKLWFYYIGFAGDPSKKFGEGGLDNTMRSGMYGNGATGVAFLRRDGFVSFNTNEKQGSLTTRLVTFSGRHLFVNADVPEGTLTAEVLDMNGIPIEPFTFGNCIPFAGDSTLTQISWKGGDDLTALAGRAVRFRFRLKNGKLYSFWVSRDETGRSDGYVAGGGPGFTCDMDTVGMKALEENKKFSP
jgi:hypothetical protein